MMKMDKVTYYTDNKRVVAAVTRWMGRLIRAEARCSPFDTFSFEKGKRIAGLRLKIKAHDMQLREMNNDVERRKQIAMDFINSYNKKAKQYNDLLSCQIADCHRLCEELEIDDLFIVENVKEEIANV